MLISGQVLTRYNRLAMIALSKDGSADRHKVWGLAPDVLNAHWGGRPNFEKMYAERPHTVYRPLLWFLSLKKDEQCKGESVSKP